MLVSFIIPAYNASTTITRCMDSIYNLNLESSSFEVIIIDDSSTDNTVDIIQSYSTTHPNITLLIQPENHRQGAARNRGVSISHGKYIHFLDSDDEIDYGIVSAIAIAERHSLDICLLKAKQVSTDQEVIKSYELPYDSDTVFGGIEFQEKYPFWCTAPWAYLFKKEFIEKVSYPFAEDVFYEDSDFVNVHLYNAKRICYADQCCYIMHENPTSTTHTLSYKHISDYALLGTRMLSFYNSLSNKESKFASLILEGGSYNIMKSCKNLFKLKSKQAIRSFYDRFDTYTDRLSLLQYREPKYCWTKWTRFCLSYRQLATFVVCVAISSGLTKQLKNIR